MDSLTHIMSKLLEDCVRSLERFQCWFGLGVPVVGLDRATLDLRVSSCMVGSRFARISSTR